MATVEHLMELLDSQRAARPSQSFALNLVFKRAENLTAASLFKRH